MLSRNKAKFIISLQRKKVREEEKLFVIEGDKIVREFLAAKVPVKTVLGKAEFLNSLPQDQVQPITELEEVSYEELKQVSTLTTPHNALAVVHMPENELDIEALSGELWAALDSVQDPGNLGTIIRAAGWFGIENIICSPDSVDVYNPKVVQASMGALLHVNVYYNELKDVLAAARKNRMPVFGTVLEGKSVYQHKLAPEGIILLGNESRGISENLIPRINHKIMIPRFGHSGPGLDSLNVGMAASVIFSEFRRRNF
ncbi:MAG TPA: RNA methyltransferase [Bacteroidales bacterium]|nr:RNA methyltransferase [Bacteroidales bacterium]